MLLQKQYPELIEPFIYLCNSPQFHCFRNHFEISLRKMSEFITAGYVYSVTYANDYEENGLD